MLTFAQNHRQIEVGDMGNILLGGFHCEDFLKWLPLSRKRHYPLPSNVQSILNYQFPYIQNNHISQLYEAIILHVSNHSQSQPFPVKDLYPTL